MRSTVWLGLTTLSLACGGTPPPQQASSQTARVAKPSHRKFEDCVAVSDVQRALEARKMAFQDCYADGLSIDPELKGTVTLNVVIPPSGELVEVRVASSDLSSEKVTACIAEVAGGLTFEQETCSLPQTVEYPVRLARGSSEFASVR